MVKKLGFRNDFLKPCQCKFFDNTCNHWRLKIASMKCEFACNLTKKKKKKKINNLGLYATRSDGKEHTII